MDSQSHRSDHVLLGRSPRLLRVRNELLKAALTEVPILITGEIGTGKKLAARLLHGSSYRAANPFYQGSCRRISDQHVDTELFSWPSAIFAGTNPLRTGRGEQTDRGTLLLDEIGDLDLTLQAKLSYALEDAPWLKLGWPSEHRTDVRLVCTTSQNLLAQIVRGTFRADLFYRLNVVAIHMPPLRDRPGDVVLLMEHFLRSYNFRFETRRALPSPPVMERLASYHWPGNLHELKDLTKRYVITGQEDQLLAALSRPETVHPDETDGVDLTTPLRVQTERALQHLEQKIVWGVLEAHRWNCRRTAQSLDISYRALLDKIKEVGLPPGSPGGSFKVRHPPP